MNWRKQQQQAARKEVPISGRKNHNKSMMQRILNSKNLVAFVLAAARHDPLFSCALSEGISFCGSWSAVAVWI